MYEEEGEQTKDIPAFILENNLYGIDIDRRCYQLASFALTMKARAYYRSYLRNTVNPHVIALEKIDRDVIESAGNWDEKSLMWQFENIDTIGSLLKITPEECEAIKIDNGLFRERQGILKTQAEYLSRRYHCVVTNPPYLGKGMGDSLKDYLQIEYPNSKSDTMATFMERSY
jgi:type I restriction-modification system DNA methylase subunit